MLAVSSFWQRMCSTCPSPLHVRIPTSLTSHVILSVPPMLSPCLQMSSASPAHRLTPRHCESICRVAGTSTSRVTSNLNRSANAAPILCRGQRCHRMTSCECWACTALVRRAFGCRMVKWPLSTLSSLQQVPHLHKRLPIPRAQRTQCPDHRRQLCSRCTGRGPRQRRALSVAGGVASAADSHDAARRRCQQGRSAALSSLVRPRRLQDSCAALECVPALRALATHQRVLPLLQRRDTITRHQFALHLIRDLTHQCGLPAVP